MWLIGSDGGYLRASVRLKQLLLAPAARADVIVEFASLRPGATVTLRNVGPDEPYNGDDDEAADPRTTGQVMQFRADRRLTSPDPDHASLATRHAGDRRPARGRATGARAPGSVDADGRRKGNPD
ncbi:MAG: hypothetical protein ACXW3U_14350 [Rhodoplanes sp.]